MIKKCLIALIILLVWSSYSWAACDGSTSGSSPTLTAYDASYDCVNLAVNTDAASGDTVNIPPGIEPWDNYLTISQSIKLIGAGSSSTVITASGELGGSYDGLIKIIPSDGEPNDTIRVSGMELDGADANTAIYIYHDSTTEINNIRIDNLKIENVDPAAFHITGPVYGVIDSNTIDLDAGMHLADIDLTEDLHAWNNYTQAYASAKNIYFEDNTITGNNFLATSGQGARYIFRYNDFTRSSNSSMSLWDVHGNQGVQYENLSTMVVEIYGNHIDQIDTSYTSWVVDHRGGWLLLFFNKLDNAGTSAVYYTREEYVDDYKGRAFTMKPNNAYYWANFRDSGTLIAYDATYLGNNNCCVNSEAWQASNAYGSQYCANITGDSNGNCWRTIDDWTPGTTGDSGVAEPDWESNSTKMDVVVDNDVTWLNMGTNENHIVENTDFFVQKTGSFDGTGSTGGGVGCGTLGSRPATCTVGVGYWATDQSCSDLTNTTGVNPTTPISGTLYKCTSTDTWESYYEPYEYPHSLREVCQGMCGISCEGCSMQ